jgi:hypothetical protein
VAPAPAIDWDVFGAILPAKPAHEITIDFKPVAESTIPIVRHTPSWRRLSLWIEFMSKSPKKKKKFVCSYAHDVACFADFVVEATSKREATKIIRKALIEGRFDGAEAPVCWENGVSNERVFVRGESPEFSPVPTIDELVAEWRRSQ